MDMSEVLSQLSQMFKDRDWFHDVGVEQFGRPVVYVKYACHETLHDIPDTFGGKQVLVHFAASKLASREQFTNSSAPKLSTPSPVVVPVVDTPPDFNALCEELDRLEKSCGTNTLQDIFYEVHDGKNAVTNLSSRYPDVRASLEKLYETYGFDVIYEEMDG
jgi:hypothetical protein